MYQILSYLKFLIKSTNQHGVHSPFVYNFVTKCLYDRTNYPEYKNLISYRKKLLKSNKTLQIKDFGAGSKLMGKHKRQVSKMVKNSSSTLKDAKLLFRVSKYFKFKNILELGTSLGVGTQALSLGLQENKLVTVEGCIETFQHTKKQLSNQKLSNINFINSDFNSAISNLTDTTLDAVFFDGHHSKAATLKYYNRLKSKIHNDSVFIFDDIYWSKEMTEAWLDIVSDDAVTVSIDCFDLGFIFFRKEQNKEHFTIRL